MTLPEQPSKPHSSWAVREIDQLWHRFGRYTRFVVYSKWSLLGVALALMGSLIVWPLISKDKSGLRVSFVDRNSVKSPPESPVMSHPVYTGSNDAGQQYKITGARAVQNTPSQITLEQVEAQVTRPDGAVYTLSAARAEYFQDKKRLELSGAVTVKNAGGSRFSTEHATVETDTMRVFGHDLVHGDGPTGQLTAGGFDIFDKGNHISFTGGAQQITVIVNRKK